MSRSLLLTNNRSRDLAPIGINPTIISNFKIPDDLIVSSMTTDTLIVNGNATITNLCTNTFCSNYANITNLETNIFISNIGFIGNLISDEAFISNLCTDFFCSNNATITNLIVETAFISNLCTDFFCSNNATITNLETNVFISNIGFIGNLTGEEAFISNLCTDTFCSNYAIIDNLDTTFLNVSNTAIIFNLITPSDFNLKSNICDLKTIITNPLDIIENIKPVSFNYENSNMQFGVIAQDYYKILDNYNIKHNENIFNGYLGVSYQDIQMITLLSVQELIKENKMLKSLLNKK